MSAPKKNRNRLVVPGAGFEPATSGHWAFGLYCSPDYESGALARLGYPGGLVQGYFV
jgi:hypothetical protein